MTQLPPRIFDRKRVRAHRNRAASDFAQFDFLHRRAMEDIVDRLETVKRGFQTAFFVGADGLLELLTPESDVGTVFHMDCASKRLDETPTALAGEEETLPVAPHCLDLFVSLLTLHTANDLVGALSQIRQSLKPDGLFIAAVFGEETLKQLRTALYQAETEITGGVSARIAPFAGVQDFGQALTRAGFAMPVVDVDKVSVRYEYPTKLLTDLRGMGEASALAGPTKALRRDVLMRALSIFADTGAAEQFEIVYLTGWAPDASQPKPLKPGAGKASLEQAIKDTL